MFRNFLRTAWKHLKNNSFYSLISIVGLGLGVAVCILIIFFSTYEFSFDKFHRDYKRIFYLTAKTKLGLDSINLPFMSFSTAPIIINNNTNVKSFCRIKHNQNLESFQRPDDDDRKFKEKNFIYADSNFFNFFSFKLLKGNPQKALYEPYSVVISEKEAAKYFGDVDVIGKSIILNNRFPLKVTGVLKQIPSNSSLQFDMVMSLSTVVSLDSSKRNLSQSIVRPGEYETYLTLPNENLQFNVQLEIQELAVKMSKSNEHFRYYLNSLSSIHFDSNTNKQIDTKYLKILPLIAFLILLIALINYMALATARAILRGKEIGVRKVLGAGRRLIALQFYLESSLYAVFAFTLGFLLFLFFRPYLCKLLEIPIDFTYLFDPKLLGIFLLLFFITIFTAGSYPSIVLSLFNPADVLNGKMSKQATGSFSRKIFIILQFSSAATLIIFTITLYRQIDFLKNADVGVRKDNVLMIPFSEAASTRSFQAYKKALYDLPEIEKIAVADYPLYSSHDNVFITPKNQNQDIPVASVNVDKQFINMLELKWKIAPPDSSFIGNENVIFINETAIKNLNLNNNPINQTINIYNKDYAIGGVLKDFNFENFHTKINALCLFAVPDTTSSWSRGSAGWFMFKFNPNANIELLINKICQVQTKYDSSIPFETTFLIKNYNDLFSAQEKIEKLFINFSILAVCIASFGLIGLTVFSTNQRLKEISIRKVLGASVLNILILINKEFVSLVLLSLVMSIPLAIYYSQAWLNDFAFRITLKPLFVLYPSICLLFGTLLIASAIALQAALKNPVKNISSE